MESDEEGTSGNPTDPKEKQAKVAPNQICNKN
jgi:hypothetical protein